jgi:hypothetical protein
MMYATLVSSKSGSQPSSITRALPALVAVAAVLVCADLRAQIEFKSGGRPTWTEAPGYLDLFAPKTHRSAYRAYVSPLDLEATLKQLLADPGVLHPPGAWALQAMIPYDAFGLTGSYNRWKVAGLYRSRRAQVVRGPRLDQGQTESWTLIAPYPDETLQRLEPGTLIIVLRLPSD